MLLVVSELRVFNKPLGLWELLWALAQPEPSCLQLRLMPIHRGDPCGENCRDLDGSPDITPGHALSWDFLLCKITHFLIVKTTFSCAFLLFTAGNILLIPRGIEIWPFRKLCIPYTHSLTQPCYNQSERHLVLIVYVNEAFWKISLINIQGCCGLNVGIPHNSYAEVLNPKVMVLDGGGGGLWEVISSWRWCPHDGISVLTKETPERFLASFCHVGRQSSVNQKQGPHQTPNLLALWSWTCQPPELGEKKRLSFKPPSLHPGVPGLILKAQSQLGAPPWAPSFGGRRWTPFSASVSTAGRVQPQSTPRALLCSCSGPFVGCRRPPLAEARHPPCCPGASLSPARDNTWEHGFWLGFSLILRSISLFWASEFLFINYMVWTDDLWGSRLPVITVNLFWNICMCYSPLAAWSRPVGRGP